MYLSTNLVIDDAYKPIKPKESVGMAECHAKERILNPSRATICHRFRKRAGYLPHIIMLNSKHLQIGSGCNYST